ncbi:MAG TPA: radical SAM protein [Planktothrix sp.]|jgi:radical SAM superfamily enzyme YgiQ (UPF0313 family)
MPGKEVFLVERPIKEQPLFAVSWLFPNTYNVGMSGLGYQLVWWLLEQDTELLVKRGFQDWQDPNCQSSELVGFTVSWELDFINIIAMLKELGMPILSSERGDDDAIVFGGGPVLSANPEPFAEIFDVVLLGDAEATVPLFVAAWKEARRLRSRKERLVRLAAVPGIYVPSLYEVTYKGDKGPVASIKPLDQAAPEKLSKQLYVAPPDYLAHTLIVSTDTAWGDIFLAEVVRSCPQECRFCLASFLTRPFRPVNVEALLAAIDLGLKHTKNIGLLGPSVTEHPQFDQIAEQLMTRSDARISVASVRADSLNETILLALKKLGQKSVTIAIESGSERLRTVMKKNLNESEIKHAVKLIDDSGLQGIKFYGIVGLPHESEADLEETVRLVRELKKEHRRLRFVFGVSSFVPKAQTPFQWNGRDKRSAEKLEYIRKHLAKAGIEVRPESHNWSDIQAVISRGDRRLTPVLLAVAAAGGKLGAWKRAWRNLPDNCPDLDYYAFREIPQDEVLPWSHLVEAAKTDYLSKHNVAAQLAASS